MLLLLSNRKAATCSSILTTILVAAIAGTTIISSSSTVVTAEFALNNNPAVGSREFSVEWESTDLPPSEPEVKSGLVLPNSNSAPSGILPFPNCRKYYGKFISGRDDLRICDNDGVTVFKTEEIVSKGNSSDWNRALVTGISGGALQQLLISSSSSKNNNNKYILTRQRTTKPRITGFANVQESNGEQFTDFTWQLFFNASESVSSLIQLPSQQPEDNENENVATIAVGQRGSIKLLVDLNLDTGNVTQTGTLAFDSSNCESQRFSPKINPLAITKEGLLVAGTFSPLCGVNIFSKTTVDAALSGRDTNDDGSPLTPVSIIGGGGNSNTTNPLFGGIYGIIQLRNSSLAINFITPIDFDDREKDSKFVLQIYDVTTNIESPVLLSSRQAKYPPSSGVIQELDDGTILCGCSELDTFPQPILTIFTDDDIFYLKRGDGIPKTDPESFLQLKSGRTAIGTDFGVQIYVGDLSTDNGGKYCKKLRTSFEATSLQELEDGSLYVGSDSGRVYIFPPENVEGPCDDEAQPVLSLAGTENLGLRSFPFTLEDDTIVAYQTSIDQRLSQILLYDADSINEAILEGTTSNTTIIAPSTSGVFGADVRLRDNPPPQVVVGGEKEYGLFSTFGSDDNVCVINFDQLKSSGDATCEFLKIPGGDIFFISYASVGDTSFVALYPGESADPRPPFPRPGINFTLQFYELEDNAWKEGNVIDGSIGSKGGGVIELWDKCLAININQILFLLQSGSTEFVQLEFPSSINYIKVIDGNTPELAVGVGLNVYVLTDEDLRGCSADATLDNAKGFDLTDLANTGSSRTLESYDDINRLSDGSTAIAASRFDVLRIFPDGPSLPFTKSPFVNLNLRQNNRFKMSIIDEYQNPTTNENSIIYNQLSQTGAFWTTKGLTEEPSASPTVSPTVSPTTKNPTPEPTRKRFTKKSKSRKSTAKKIKKRKNEKQKG